MAEVVEKKLGSLKVRGLKWRKEILKRALITMIVCHKIFKVYPR